MFKPMLAATAKSIEDIRLPAIVSPKLDGIRCVIRQNDIGVTLPFSRTLKLIPNLSIQEKLSGVPLFDGELIVGSPTAPDVWNVTSSAVMSIQGTPDFRYYVFDHSSRYKDTCTFRARLDAIAEELSVIGHDRIVQVPHHIARTRETLIELEQRYVSEGYEGIMVRDPDGMYKYGRSTVKEGGLLKLKRWLDDEATIIGVTERQHNGNVPTFDALGHTVRSRHQDGLSGRGDLGTFIVTNDTGQTFEIGSGFTDRQRAEFWMTQWYGRRVTYKYQGLTPAGLPRFPIFKGVRLD